MNCHVQRRLWAVVLLWAATGATIAAKGEEPSLSRAEFDRLHKELNLKNQPWATIPWKVTLVEAREVAAREKKPIFMVVNTGNCLGFV